jgi:hypothetical protein
LGVGCIEAQQLQSVAFQMAPYFIGKHLMPAAMLPRHQKKVDCRQRAALGAVIIRLHPAFGAEYLSTLAGKKD